MSALYPSGRKAVTAPGIDEYAQSSRDRWMRILLFGIILGLVLRFAIGYVFTFNYDTNAWLITSDSVDAYGSIYQANGLWYPPVWGCILTFVSYFVNIIGIDTGTICYELAGSGALANISSTYVLSPNYAIVLKSVLFFFDLLNAWLIFRIVDRNHETKKAVIASLLWFLCPLVIWSSSIACQIDTLSATFMILSMYFLIERKYFLAGAMLSVGFLTKLFPICLMFLFVAYVLSHSYGRRDKLINMVVGIAGAGIMAALLLMPYLMNGELSSVFSFYSGRAGQVAVDNDDISRFSPLIFNNIINYLPLIILAMVLIAVSYYRRAGWKGEDEDRSSFLTHALMTFIPIFIFSQSLTYLVVIIPLLAGYIALTDRRLVVTYALFSVINVLYCFSNFHVWLLTSASVFWGIIPIETIIQMAADLAPFMSQLFDLMANLGVLPMITAVILMVYRRFEYEKA